MDSKYTSIRTNLDVPLDLSGPLPRTIRLSESSRLFPIAIVSVMVLTIVGCLWYCKHAVHEMRERAALSRDGVEVRGKIIEIHRAGRGPDVVHYAFTVNDVTFSGTNDVPPKLMRSLQTSNSIILRYIPSNPNVNHPEAWEWSLASEWPVIFMLLGFVLVSCAGCISFFRQRQVAAYGNSVVGTVTKCQMNGRGQIRIRYEFQTKTGAPFTGTSYSAIRQEIGTSVWILYLPQNPKRNLLYPVPGYDVSQ